MSSQNNLDAYTPAQILGSTILASTVANCAATGNAVANLAILGGGVTSSGGAYTVRRVTVINTGSGNINGAQVTIISSNDGNASNAITANTNLSSLSGNNTFQELALNATANSTLQTVSALFVDVQASNASATALTVKVYGDVISP